MINPHPTSYPELNQVLNELVSGVQSVLANDLVAAVLQGSFAIGDAEGQGYGEPTRPGHLPVAPAVHIHGDQETEGQEYRPEIGSVAVELAQISPQYY